jgi:hypothetical protein
MGNGVNEGHSPVSMLIKLDILKTRKVIGMKIPLGKKIVNPVQVEKCLSHMI